MKTIEEIVPEIITEGLDQYIAYNVWDRSSMLFAILCHIDEDGNPAESEGCPDYHVFALFDEGDEVWEDRHPLEALHHVLMQSIIAGPLTADHLKMVALMLVSEGYGILVDAEEKDDYKRGDAKNNPNARELVMISVIANGNAWTQDHFRDGERGELLHDDNDKKVIDGEMIQMLDVIFQTMTSEKNPFPR